MGAGAFVEPLVVVVLLFGGTWINRNKKYRLFAGCGSLHQLCNDDMEGVPFNSVGELGNSSPGLLQTDSEPTWRRREVVVCGWRSEITSPNTHVFKDRFLSRLLLRFPFLVEAWYWALIYWVYQLGRAFTAVNMAEGTVHVARRHALQLVHLEQRLRIFWEPAIQAVFLRHELLMHWINRIYSFIHIPGTIFFLVWLYYYTTATTTLNELNEWRTDKVPTEITTTSAGPRLYEARRRTMALCNLIAFVIFTAWPCMPPRLLSDKDLKGPLGEEARSYGFVDTVHGANGESSVWTQNKFCNQYAAMPSLHFGYALMIGLSVAIIPLSPQHRRPRSIGVPILGIRFRSCPSPRRLLCLFLGFLYPFIILVAIITTANHFILDAVAGACVCAAGWWGNTVLLNLLPLEDYFLWCVKIHKPTRISAPNPAGESIMESL